MSSGDSECRLKATQFWHTVPRWTSLEFRELQRQFVDAETGLERAKATLRALRMSAAV
jgi:hypothetical protein